MKSWVRRPIITVFIVTILALLINTSVLAAVQLLYFRGEVDNLVVNLTWDAATETDTLGYIIYRSVKGSDAYPGYTQISVTYQQEVTDLILARSIDEDPSNDYSPYFAQDTNVSNNVKYWYKLAEIEQGNPYPIDREIITVVIGSPPVVETSPPAPNSTSTPTRTPTRTSTGTATQSQSSSGVKSGANRTSNQPSPTYTKPPTIFRQPTNTSANLPASSTPVPGAEAQPVDANATESGLTGTPTLEPAPRITMVLGNSPAQAEEVTITAITTAEPATQSSGWISKKGLTIIGVLAAVWLALGAWFFLSFRRME